MLHESVIIEQFRSAMREQDIAVSADIIADGKFHRVHVDGDKPKTARNGWYVLHCDGKPSGAFGCNKRYGNLAKFTWSGKSSKPLSPEERKAFRERMERQREERAVQLLKQHADAAQHANLVWDVATEATSHAYLERKGIKSHGLRVGVWEKTDIETGEIRVITKQALLVPLRDIKKKIHSLQAIFSSKIFGDRDKDFLKDGCKEGLFYSIGKPLTVNVGGVMRAVIIIGEGYATLASLHEVTGHACIVAFDAGNLMAVGKVFRERFPDAVLLFAADNDQWTLKPIVNPGLFKATEAAKAVNGLVALPPFAVDSIDKPTDFNDLCSQRGGFELTRKIIEDALNPPAPVVPEPPPWEGEPDFSVAEDAPEPDDGGADEDEDDDARPENNSHFTILGYNRETYYIFQHGKRQISERTKGDFSEVGLIELADINWWEMNFPGERVNIDTKAAAQFIIRTAERRGIFDNEKIRGRGAWLDEQRMVYHHGSHLSVDGAHVDVTRIKSKYIYEMAPAMQFPGDTMLTSDEGQRIIDIMKMFRWSVGGSALLFSGWIALAPICGAIPWRPHLWMTGGAGSGKSSLAKFGHSLLKGTDVFAQGNSSEAGIRQRLRADARPVIMDESESNEEGDAKRVQSILGLIRQASTESDAETLKGTTDGTGTTYHIRSMFCLASIQVALKNKADIDRLTVLTLKSGKEADAASGTDWSKIKECLYQLTGREDSTVRARLLRRSIELLPVTLKNIDVFSSVGADVFGSQRDGDQYGALLAGAWSLISVEVASREQARIFFDAHDWQELRDNADTDESQRALSSLMEAHIRVKGGVELTVHELIKLASGKDASITDINDVTADAVLQRYGMKLKGGWLVMANNSTELRKLMHGTTFEADWRGMLLRVEGADKNGNKPERFNGVQNKCIRLPLGPLVNDGDAPAF